MVKVRWGVENWVIMLNYVYVVCFKPVIMFTLYVSSDSAAAIDTDMVRLEF